MVKLEDVCLGDDERSQLGCLSQAVAVQRALLAASIPFLRLLELCRVSGIRQLAQPKKAREVLGEQYAEHLVPT